MPIGNDDDDDRPERALVVAYNFPFDALAERRSGSVGDSEEGNGRKGYGGPKNEDDKEDGSSTEIALLVFFWLS